MNEATGARGSNFEMVA